MKIGGLIYASAALSQSKLSALSIGKAQELVFTWWRGEIPIQAGNRRLVLKFPFIYFIFKRVIWCCSHLAILYNIGGRWRNVGYWWNNPDGGKTETTRPETFPSTTFSTTNPTLCGQGQNPGLRGVRQATNCFRHGPTIHVIDWVVRIQIFFYPRTLGCENNVLPRVCSTLYVPQRRPSRISASFSAGWRRNTSRILTVGTDATKLRSGVFSHSRELRANEILCNFKLSDVSCGEIIVF